MVNPPPRRPTVRARLVTLRGEGAAREVLLAFHRHPDRAFWCFPGGVVEAGEALAVAARREALEETGVHLRLGGICYVQDRWEADSLDVFFTAVAPGGQAALGTDPDRPAGPAPILADLRWVPLRELPQLAILPGELAAALHDGRFFGWGSLPLPQ